MSQLEDLPRRIGRFVERVERTHDIDFASEVVSGPEWHTIEVHRTDAHVAVFLDGEFHAGDRAYADWLERIRDEEPARD